MCLLEGEVDIYVSDVCVCVCVFCMCVCVMCALKEK
jgi:hypothetical protein